MIVFPNAKINLGLNVVARRDDGYHDIETVFYPVPLCDALEILPAANGETVFTQFGIPVDGSAEDNLVMKAYRLLKTDFLLPAVDIYLRKQIPAGAGLGGGSSDAAFMLKLLNNFAELGLSDDKLEEYASRLGADCPVFIRNRPVFAEGTGNIFSQVDLSLSGYSLVLIKPDIHISTKEAYAAICPHKPDNSIRDIVKTPVAEWKNLLVNDFEEGVFAREPEIGKIKQELYDAGAVYASMSGSGSAVYGIFDSAHFPEIKSAIIGKWSL
jgi:4-diphosphocytidyl-2-C-methyl-D-erythritol kinase